MNKLLKTITVISTLILVIDILVLTALKDVWKSTVELIQHKPFKVKLHYALACYMLLIFGHYYFVFKNIDRSNWIEQTLKNGFLFGFVTYGVFDLTNLAILTDYPLSVAALDMMWGGILMALVSFLSYYVLHII
jgi:uncharacterized membrane protein